MNLAQKDSEVRELQGRLHQTELNNALQQDLLRHMMDDQVNLEVDDLMARTDEPDGEKHKQLHKYTCFYLTWQLSVLLR